MEQRVRERTAELSLANDELTRQAVELRESQTLMASIIETAPDAIVTIDHLGRDRRVQSRRRGDLRLLEGEATWSAALDDLIVPPARGRRANAIGAYLG